MERFRGTIPGNRGSFPEISFHGQCNTRWIVANRDNHYEAAFEDYLRARGIPYVAVDEAKRSLLSSGASIKSLDL